MEQSKGIPLRKKKYLLRDSDRSGFTYRNVELFNDNGFLVGGDEIDAPPPSNRLYSDEGGISPGDIRTNATDYSVQPSNYSVTQVVEASSTINLNRKVDNAGQYSSLKSIVYVAGSNSAVTLSSNPQINASQHADILTVYGAGSSVILQNGNGLRLYSKYLKLDSGSMVTFIYNSTDGLWCETSRMNPNFALTGEF